MENQQARQEAERLKEVGQYDVMICEPRWEEMPEKNGDDARLALVLPCYTEPDEEHPAGQFENFYLYFTRQIITGGRNKGRTLYETSMQHCLELGMSAPFNPEKIHELNGQTAVLVMKKEVYKGKEQIKPAFLNAQKYTKISTTEANAIWNKMTDGKAPQAQPEPQQTATELDPKDDLPF